jgi:tetratricopeptide (TPR) repeat protein
MTAIPPKTESSPAATSKRRKLLLLILSLAVTLGLLAWFGHDWLRPAATPPFVDLSGIDDPEVAKAIEAALTEVHRKPRDPDAWSNLALTLFAHDFYIECVPCFAEAERMTPKDLRWPYFQGLALLRTNPAAALPHLERAAELAERESVPHIRLAEALQEQGQLAAAAERYQKALHLDPGHPRILLGLGTVLLKQGDAKGSVPLLQGAVNDITTRKSANAMLAEAYQQLGERDRETQARQIAMALPEDQQWFDPLVESARSYQKGLLPVILTAKQLIETNHCREALDLMIGTLPQYPNNAQVFLYLARARVMLGEYAEAENAAREALRLKPEDFQEVDVLGRSLYGQKRYQVAEEQFRRALRLKPDDALTQYRLGQCRLEQGDRSGAIAAWQEALRSQPNARIHFELGDLLAQEGRTKEALGNLDDAVRLEPQNEQFKKRRDELKTATKSP